jgi:hypothetical protein
MKTKFSTFNFQLSILLALLITLTGCSGDDDNNNNNNGGDDPLDVELEVERATSQFTYAAGTEDLEVYATDPWTAAVNAAATWCTVSPASGNGDGYITITVTPNANPLSEARSATITLTSEDLTATVAVTQEVIQTTVCTQCLWDGEAWVDGRVTATNFPFDTTTAETDVPWSGVDDWGAWINHGATSDKDGRANTAKITSVAGSAAQICKDLGEGWYLPAYEELYNLSTASPIWGGLVGQSPLNGLTAAGLIVAPTTYAEPEGILYWSSTEFGEQEGRLDFGGSQESITLGAEHSCAVSCSYIGNSPYSYKTNANMLLQCVWRP